MTERDPYVIKHQDDDGTEWFEICHTRYFRLARDPAQEHLRGYMGSQVIQKFSADGVANELTTHFAIEAATIQQMLEKARARFAATRQTR